MTDDKKKTARRERDDYQTPFATIEPLLNLINWSRISTFLEPCAGDGAILDAIKGRWFIESCIDGHTQPMLVDHHCEIREGLDYLTYTPPCDIDLCISNPPFSLAHQFLEKSLREAACVIYLLPLGFLSSSARREWWRSNPPTNIVTVTERPSFVWVCSSRTCKHSDSPGIETCAACGSKMKRQTDFSDVAWYVWDRGRMLTTRAPFVWI